MTRPDLDSAFDGWQTSDPTPQETSEGEQDPLFVVLNAVGERWGGSFMMCGVMRAPPPAV